LLRRGRFCEPTPGVTLNAFQGPPRIKSGLCPLHGGC
jgi:hypothetical protein